MYKIGIGILCLIAVAVFGLTVNVSGQDSDSKMSVPMGSIDIKSPVNPDNPGDKASVVFPHGKHFASNDCKTCHHKWEGIGNIQGCQTSACHGETSAKKKDGKYLAYDKEAIKYFKYAYHRQCIGCHKEIKKKNKTIEATDTDLAEKLQSTGPTGCVGCHPKQ